MKQQPQRQTQTSSQPQLYQLSKCNTHCTWKRTTTSLSSGAWRSTRPPAAVHRLRHTTRAKAERASTREGCPSSVHTSSTSTAREHRGVE